MLPEFLAVMGRGARYLTEMCMFWKLHMGTQYSISALDLIQPR